MKKAIKTITILFIIIALLTAAAAAFFFYKDIDCGKTKMPDNLSATAAVQKYFEYLDDGNNAGIRLITVQDISLEENTDSAAETDSSAAAESTRNYLPVLDLFTSVQCSKCTLLDEKAEQYKSYYDNAIVSVNFTYKAAFMFRDEDIPSSAEGWEFCLVKEEENSPWKIISITKN